MKPGDKLYLVQKYHRDNKVVTVKSVGRRWVRFEKSPAWKMDKHTWAMYGTDDWPIGQCHESQAAWEQEIANAKARSLFRHRVMESKLLNMAAVRKAAEILGLELDA